MNDPQGISSRIELLRSLLDRLESPELTLHEARLLRSQIGLFLDPEGSEYDRSPATCTRHILPTISGPQDVFPAVSG